MLNASRCCVEHPIWKSADCHTGQLFGTGLKVGPCQCRVTLSSLMALLFFGAMSKQYERICNSNNNLPKLAHVVDQSVVLKLVESRLGLLFVFMQTDRKNLVVFHIIGWEAQNLRLGEIMLCLQQRLQLLGWSQVCAKHCVHSFVVQYAKPWVQYLSAWLKPCAVCLNHSASAPTKIVLRTYAPENDAASNTYKLPTYVSFFRGL